MHELSLATAIVELVERHAEGRRVSVVNVKVGALRQVVPRSLEFQFRFAASGSVCKGARLEQKLIAARLRCEDCRREWDPAPPPARSADELVVSFRCPGCESARFEVTAGEELEVASIEVSDHGAVRSPQEEERCTAPG
jgi:hydrogenase nickel incorporation protein HypA/HybF